MPELKIILMPKWHIWGMIYQDPLQCLQSGFGFEHLDFLIGINYFDFLMGNFFEIMQVMWHYFAVFKFEHEALSKINLLVDS